MTVQADTEAARDKARRLDAYLVAAARTGEPRALTLLARRWGPRLIAHGWRLTGDVDLAQEATQDGWIEIQKGIARLGDEAAFPAWAYRIITRRCARLIRGRRRSRALTAAVEAEGEALSLWIDAGSLSDPIALSRLKSALAALPADQRAAVALFHLEDLSVAETAVALNVPAGTVKTRLMHARRKLRAALEGPSHEGH